MLNVQIRSAWEKKTLEIPNYESTVAENHKVAQATGDKFAIDFITRQKLELDKLVKSFTSARGAYEKLDAKHKHAADAREAAYSVMNRGTHDASEAQRNYAIFVIAEAELNACAHELAEMQSKVETARIALQPKNHGAEALLKQGETYIAELCSVREFRRFKNGAGEDAEMNVPTGTTTRPVATWLATRDGATIDSALASWLPFSDFLIREAFKRALKAVKDQKPDVYDYRRQERFVPTFEDLEVALKARRDGYEMGQRAKKAKLEALQADLQVQVSK